MHTPIFPNRTRPLLNLLTLFLAAQLLGGCAEVGPDYKRSELKTDKQFEETTPAQLDPAEVIRRDWWAEFNDPTLTDLIDTGLTGSYDLKILVSRVLAAGAMIDQNEADLYPSLGSETGARFSDSKETGDSQSFTAGLNLSWELDIWGKNKRRVKAAKAEQQAVKADYRAGYLTLVSDVAISYFTIRQYDAMLALTKSYIKDNELILTIYQQQAAAGIESEDKVYRQRALVNENRQDLLEAQRGRAIQEHKLAALLGKPTSEVKLDRGTNPSLKQLPEVPVGLPSELLNRRPDILAAEYRLNKATQEIGAAKAARLPSISLTARGGFTSAALSSLLSGGFLGFLPNINLPIFDGGRGKAEVQKAIHEMEVEKNKWAKTANTAFQEVADSLTNLANRKEQLSIAGQRVADLKKIQAQLKSRLELGLISQLELIDVQQSLFEALKAEKKISNQLFRDTVLLYKALGGGWPDSSATVTAK
ncbi:MAG: efflux transporter outer membrane subunit [Thermodesulfobacteriota bacterium]